MLNLSLLSQSPAIVGHSLRTLLPPLLVCMLCKKRSCCSHAMMVHIDDVTEQLKWQFELAKVLHSQCWQRAYEDNAPVATW
jgi:hypothetical protein